MAASVKAGWSGYAKNPTLYVKNVPEALPQSMLEDIFKTMAGYQQVRIVHHMSRMVFVGRSYPPSSPASLVSLFFFILCFFLSHFLSMVLTMLLSRRRCRCRCRCRV